MYLKRFITSVTLLMMALNGHADPLFNPCITIWGSWGYEKSEDSPVLYDTTISGTPPTVACVNDSVSVSITRSTLSGTATRYDTSPCQLKDTKTMTPTVTTSWSVSGVTAHRQTSLPGDQPSASFVPSTPGTATVTFTTTASTTDPSWDDISTATHSIVIVQLGDISFSKSPVRAGDPTTATATILPSGRTVNYMLPDDQDKLGCSIDSSSGVITTTADRGGTLRVRAYDSELGSEECYKEASVTIVSIRGLIPSPGILCAGHTPPDTATVTATVEPAGRSLVWSLPVAHGCSIAGDNYGSSAVITAGSEGGEITIRATDAELPECFAEVKMWVVKIYDPTKSPDGLSAMQASNCVVGATVIAYSPVLDWTIQGEKLGCDIERLSPTTARVTAGTIAGEITVRGTYPGYPDCYIEQKIAVVKIENLQFSALAISATGPANAAARSVSASATITPSNRTIVWTLPQNADCSIVSINNTSCTIVSAGNTGGKIKVRAADSVLSNCYIERELDVIHISDISFEAPVLGSNPPVLLINGTINGTPNVGNAKATITPITRTITWSIPGDALGCTIGNDTNAGKITPGSTEGKITIRAADNAMPGIYTEAELALVLVDIDVAKIAHNAATDELDESKEESTGAFVPLNSDDDDYSATLTDSGSDKNQTGALTGENDLLPIYLRKIPDITGTKFLLDIPSTIKVWKNANRQDEVLSSTELDATVDTTVYAEGVSKGSDLLKLTFRYGGQDQSNVARLKITAFELKGVINVPGYTAYSYTADGSLPVDSKWETPTGGALKAGSTAAQTTILWDQGPVLGKAVYEVNSDYIWDLEVNVVQVKLATGASNKVVYGSSVAQHPADQTFIQSSSTPGSKAMEASLTIDKVIGPSISGATRGEQFIEIGFIQNAQLTRRHGLYDGITPPKRRRNSLQDGTYHIDCITTSGSASIIPWYDTADITGSDGFHQVPAGGITSHPLNVADTPLINATDSMILAVYSGTSSVEIDSVDRFGIEFDFNLYFAVRTVQDLNGSKDVFTQRGKASWEFNGSGSINASGVWTSTGAGNSGSASFSEVSNGDVVPVTTGTPFNTLFTTETWTTENQ